MALKIDTNNSAVAHHIIDGAVHFPYAIDAHSAVSRFPAEWSAEPWSAEATNKARQASGEELEPLTEEEQAAVDEHAEAVAEAKERLDRFYRYQAEKKKAYDQVAADEALVKSPAPVPVKRPFGRTGEPTPAEIEQIKKREAAQAERERIAAEKANADKTGTL